jgi:signal transduction histidine kinase
MKSIKYFPIIATVTIIATIMAYWVVQNNQQNFTNHKNEILNRFKSNYESIINGYERSAILFYYQVIESDEILSILRQIPESYGIEKDKLRNDLYTKLSPNYNQLKKFDFRQLHFHLPTGESFLRFHKPDKYGDNLFAIRYSIEKSNKTLKMSKGFEEGRIFNGYRFVFPILENKNHYGSVEISLSFLAISKSIKKLEKVFTNVLFKKQIIDQKLFTSEKSNYEVCASMPLYALDKSIINDSSENESYKLFSEVFKGHKKQISNLLNLKYADLIDLKQNGKNYILINIPIPNVQGKKIGNIQFLQENDKLISIKQKLFLRLGILIILYLIIIISIIAIIRRDKRLIKSREQVKKSEVNLAESGEIKNKLFEIITHDLRNHFNSVNGFVDLLEKRLDLSDEKIKKLYNGLNDAVELTNNLMDNLFVWSRIQINKIELQKSSFEGSKWLSKELQRFNSIIERKNITIINNTKGPVYFDADIDMMKYIHQNILLNAIRYSDKGGKITTQIQDHGKYTTLIVKDEGKGMSSSEVAKILNQEGLSDLKLRIKSGLGLLITRKLVEYQNGKIQIESAKGVGTKVKIEIPK